MPTKQSFWRFVLMLYAAFTSAIALYFLATHSPIPAGEDSLFNADGEFLSIEGVQYFLVGFCFLSYVGAIFFLLNPYKPMRMATGSSFILAMSLVYILFYGTLVMQRAMISQQVANERAEAAQLAKVPPPAVGVNGGDAAAEGEGQCMEDGSRGSLMEMGSILGVVVDSLYDVATALISTRSGDTLVERYSDFDSSAIPFSSFGRVDLLVLHCIGLVIGIATITVFTGAPDPSLPVRGLTAAQLSQHVHGSAAPMQKSTADIRKAKVREQLKQDQKKTDDTAAKKKQ